MKGKITIEATNYGYGIDCNLDEEYRMAVAALREQEERRWIPVAERLPEKNK